MRAPAASRSAPRSAARLAAVQALYQMDIAGTDVNRVVAEFTSHRVGQETENAALAEVDLEFFGDLVRGVVREQRRIDPQLNARLAQGWRLARIDSTLRAILRAAAYELLGRADVPARVVISEYVDVAHAFFDGEEPKMVNAVLDQLARQFRPAEFEQAANG